MTWFKVNVPKDAKVCPPHSTRPLKAPHRLDDQTCPDTPPLGQDVQGTLQISAPLDSIGSSLLHYQLATGSVKTTLETVVCLCGEPSSCPGCNPPDPPPSTPPLHPARQLGEAPGPH